MVLIFLVLGVIFLLKRFERLLNMLLVRLLVLLSFVGSLKLVLLCKVFSWLLICLRFLVKFGFSLMLGNFVKNVLLIIGFFIVLEMSLGGVIVSMVWCCNLVWVIL